MADPKPQLRFTNGYDLDLAQVARLTNQIAVAGAAAVRRGVLLDHLGLPARQLTCLISVAEGFGLINARPPTHTRLGDVFHTSDPYLSSPLAPWIFHYNLASCPYFIVWWRMANEVVAPAIRFTRAQAKMHFSDLRTRYSNQSMISHLPKELSAFFQAYTEGALLRLAYLEEQGGEYVAPSTLRVPPPAFGYSLLTFAARYREGETAISIGDIASAPSSPGRIFLMREPDVRAHLERMHRDGAISIESKGHLDQVRFAAPPEAADYLRAHFEDTED